MKLFATFLTCLFIFQTAFGQTSKPDSLHLSFDSLDISPESGSTLTLPPADDLVKIIPPSPNSAAIEQFISQPVSLHTGIPDINIPIYEIKQGSLRVPIRLNYHASGIKVNQVASWVGLGWSLEAGGEISRTIFDYPDEWPMLEMTYSASGIPMNVNYTLSDTAFEKLKAATTNKYVDVEHDQFSISAPGMSGKFMLSKPTLSSVVFFPKVPVDVSTTAFGLINGQWIVKNEAGDIYIFGNDGFKTAIELTDNITNCDLSMAQQTGPSTWHLLKIISADKKDTISFEYDSYVFSYNITPATTLTHSRAIFSDGSGANHYNPRTPGPCANMVSVAGKVIKKIKFRNGYVEFVKNNSARLDILSSEGTLQFVRVYSYTDGLLFSYELEHEYFESMNTASLENIHSSYKRLKLKQFKDVTNSCNPKPPYSFYYKDENSNQFPPTHSFQQDWWGYYNRKSSNDTKYILAPELHLVSGMTDIAVNQTLMGADRSFDVLYADRWTLNKIEYPTGGFTEFEFEPHTIKNIHPDGSVSVHSYTSGTIFTENFILTDSKKVVAFFDIESYPSLADETSRVFIRDAFGNVFPVIDGQFQILPPGNYQLVLENSYIIGDVSVLLSILPNTTSNNKKYSGIRVKSTRIHDGVNVANDLLTFYNYNHASGEYSSGVMHSVFTPEVVSSFFSTSTYWVTVSSWCNYYRIVTISRPANPFYCGISKGAPVTYSEVTQTRGNTIGNLSGKSVFRFTNGNGTFHPRVTNDYKNGLNLAEKHYKYQLGNFKKEKESFNRYRCLFSEPFWLQEVKCISSSECDTFNPLYTGIYWIFEQLFPLQTLEFFALTRSVERVYNQDNDAIYQETATNYYYENPAHLQLTRSVSKGENDIDSVETVYRYPHDFTLPTGSTDPQLLALKKMKTLNMLAVPIETFTKKYRVSTSQPPVFLNAKFNHFSLQNINGQMFPMRHKISAADLITPSSSFVTAFNPSYFAPSGLVIDPQYRERIFFEYDEKGNLVSQNKAKDIVSTYIYAGANKSFPIAEAVNAESDQILHTSFEYETTGTEAVAPDFAKTGRKFLKENVISTVYTPRPAANLRQGYYWLSFWAKGDAGKLALPGFNDAVLTENSSDWKFYRVKIVVSDGTFPNPESLPEAKYGDFTFMLKSLGNSSLDELRVYPELSLMNTITHIPLVGISSSTDVNHNTTYFEYDKYARLRLTRDFNRHILSRQKYIYGQTNIPCPDEN